MSLILKNIKRMSWFDDRFYIAQFVGEEPTRALASITTVLSASSKPWLDQVMRTLGVDELDRRKAEGADRGSKVHHAIHIHDTPGVVLFQPPEWQNFDPELFDQNETILGQCKAQGIPYFILESQEQMVMFDRAAAWTEAVLKLNPQNRIHASELTVWDLDDNTAGTLDRLMFLVEGEYPSGEASGSKLVIKETGYYVLDWKSGSTIDKEPHMQIAKYGHCVGKSHGIVVVGGLIVHLNARTKSGLKVHYDDQAAMAEGLAGFNVVKQMWNMNNPNIQPKVLSFRSAVYNPHIGSNILHGFIQPQENVGAKVTAINAAGGDLESEQPVTPAPAPEPPPPAVQEPEPEPPPVEEEPAPEDPKTELVAQAQKLLRSIFPSSSARDMKGISALIQRAFIVNGSPAAAEMKELPKLDMTVLKEGLPRLKADVAALKERANAKR